jgi:hypothetical protein
MKMPKTNFSIDFMLLRKIVPQPDFITTGIIIEKNLWKFRVDYSLCSSTTTAVP